MNKPTVQELSTEVLVRLWFRLLWQRYDHGGISVGRSRRCDLLDCYLDFTPLPELPGSCDDYYEGLEEELLARPLAPPPAIVRQSAFGTLSEADVARLGLGALLALEESVDAETAWRNGYELERKRIRAILERFPHLTIDPTERIQDVIQSLLARKADLQFETMQREWHMFPTETESS